MLWSVSSSKGGGGVFQAVSMAAAYLAVAHVGVSYVAPAFAFPLLITYALALAPGMERLAWQRATGVTVGLVGGLMITRCKYFDLTGDQDADGSALGWIIASSAIPFILAGSNLYRTQFWPKGAPPLLLAALMLILPPPSRASSRSLLKG